MRIELNKKGLGGGQYAQPGIGVKPCWDAMQTVGLLEVARRSGEDDTLLRMRYTGRVDLVLGQGGVRSRHLGDCDKAFLKEHLHFINKVHPEIPEKPTGFLELHYAEGGLQAAVFKA